MRIAYVGSRHMLSGYSGIERGLRHMAPALVRRGHQVTVFGGRLAERDRAKRFEGVDLIEVPAPGGKHSETLARTALSLALAAGRFDVIHFTHQGPAIFVPVARLFGAAAVVTAAGLDWQRDKWGRFAKFAIRSAERMSIHFADEIIVMSKAHQAYFHDVYRRSTVRIPNGVEARPRPEATDEIQRLGLAPGGYVLFAARLVPEKGCHELIAAWNGMETGKKLVIAGSAAHDLGYVESLKRAADPKTTLFTGHVSGALLDQLFAHAYLFVLPSHLEGLSVALLEALACERPVLVSDIPENREVVEEDGFTFRAGDVEDLGATLARLLADEAAVAAMAQRARRRAQGLVTWDHVAAQHEAIYEALGARKGALHRRTA